MNRLKPYRCRKCGFRISLHKQPEKCVACGYRDPLLDPKTLKPVEAFARMIELRGFIAKRAVPDAIHELRELENLFPNVKTWTLKKP